MGGGCDVGSPCLIKKSLHVDCIPRSCRIYVGGNRKPDYVRSVVLPANTASDCRPGPVGPLCKCRNVCRVNVQKISGKIYVTALDSQIETGAMLRRILASQNI